MNVECIDIARQEIAGALLYSTWDDSPDFIGVALFKNSDEVLLLVAIISRGEKARFPQHVLNCLKTIILVVTVMCPLALWTAVKTPI